ncbi:MAG: hypothetical protein ACE5O2_17100 [Armatimonadota bacterium]
MAAVVQLALDAVQFAFYRRDVQTVEFALDVRKSVKHIRKRRADGQEVNFGLQCINFVLD